MHNVIGSADAYFIT